MKKILLGLSILLSVITNVNAGKSIERYKITCEQKKDAKSCISLAQQYVERNNLPEALYYLDRACDLGSGDACMGIAYHYKFGEGVKQNFILASRYSKLVCEDPAIYKVVQGFNNWRDEVENCKGLGLLDRSNTSHNIKVLDHYAQECANGNSKICFQLGDLYNKGKTISGIKVGKSERKAKEFYKKSCDLDNGQGCFKFGKLFPYSQIKEGVEKSKIYPKLIKIFNKACSLGSSYGCKELGKLYGSWSTRKYIEQDVSKVVKYYTKGCNLSKYKDQSKSCEELGNLYRWGKGVNVNFNNMIKAYKRACKLGDEYMCSKVGDFYAWLNMYKINKKNITEEFIGDDILQQLNNDELVVKSVQIDYNQARKFYEISCSADSTFGCNGLGVLYRDGKGVEQNTVLARKYFVKGCNFGNDDKACENLKSLH